MSEELVANPTHYRESAEKLRRVASQLRFDLCRRRQLLALADGFERLAERARKELSTAAAAD
jgi:hypothetical protein